MKYAVRIIAVVEAPDAAAAADAAGKINVGLSNPILRRFLEAQGVNFVSHRVDPTPVLDVKK